MPNLWTRAARVIMFMYKFNKLIHWECSACHCQLSHLTLGSLNEVSSFLRKTERSRLYSWWLIHSCSGVHRTHQQCRLFVGYLHPRCSVSFCCLGPNSPNSNTWSTFFHPCDININNKYHFVPASHLVQCVVSCSDQQCTGLRRCRYCQQLWHDECDNRTRNWSHQCCYCTWYLRLLPCFCLIDLATVLGL